LTFSIKMVEYSMVLIFLVCPWMNLLFLLKLLNLHLSLQELLYISLLFFFSFVLWRF